MRRMVDAIVETGKNTGNTDDHEINSESFRKRPWSVYRKDAARYVAEYGRITRWYPKLDTLPDRLKTRHEKGERVLIVDIFGVANAKSIGADKTIGFTLRKSQAIEKSPDMTVVDGDVFSTRDQQKLMRAIDSEHAPISCVFLFPIEGLKYHGQNIAVLSKLYGLLRKLYLRLAEEGEIYAHVDHSVAGAVLVRALNALSETPICEYDKENADKFDEIHGFRIVKHRDAPTSLPNINELPISERDRKILEDELS